MDLNPFTDDWSYETGPFELASYCQEISDTKPRTRVLVALCAWLDQLEQ
jgi:protein N-terminal amidase